MCRCVLSINLGTLCCVCVCVCGPPRLGRVVNELVCLFVAWAVCYIYKARRKPFSVNYEMRQTVLLEFVYSQNCNNIYSSAQSLTVDVSNWKKKGHERGDEGRLQKGLQWLKLVQFRRTWISTLKMNHHICIPLMGAKWDCVNDNYNSTQGRPLMYVFPNTPWTCFYRLQKFLR